MTSRDIRKFDPKLFAALDADMWMAYYNHRFFRLFMLLFRLNYTYFQPSLMLTVQGAYHSAAAAIVFRKSKGDENTERIIKHLERFYELLAVHNTAAFDHKKAATLELEWWLVDRYPDRYKNTRAVALAESMAVVYRVPVSKLMRYGQKRAQAMEMLGSYHYDPTAAVDWVKLRNLLLEAYSALHKAVAQGE